MAIWTYLPNTVSYRFQKPMSHQRFGKIWIRKYKRREYWKLFYIMWFFVFLTFSIRIGISLVLPFQNLSGLYSNLYIYDIDLPYAELQESLLTSRHCTHVSFHEDLILRYNGFTIEIEDIKSLMENTLIQDPQNIFVLIIDKNLEMGNVNLLLNEMRKVGWVRIHFLTNKYNE